MTTKNIEDNIKQFLQKKNFKADRRFIVFLFFVAISTIFWLLNQLEDEYETDIQLPIRYSEFPQDKILISELPDYFTLRVKAHGFKLLEYKISNKFLPYPINVNSLTLKMMSEERYLKLYALTRILKDDVERKLSSELEIISISPDTLYFDFAERVFKKVPVVSRLNPIPATQFMVDDDIALIPDSIIISGANHIIDTTYQVFTQKRELVDLEAPFAGDVKLEKIKNIDFSEDRCSLQIVK